MFPESKGKPAHLAKAKELSVLSFVSPYTRPKSAD